MDNEPVSIEACPKCRELVESLLVTIEIKNQQLSELREELRDKGVKRNGK